MRYVSFALTVLTLLVLIGCKEEALEQHASGSEDGLSQDVYTGSGGGEIPPYTYTDDSSTGEGGSIPNPNGDGNGDTGTVTGMITDTFTQDQYTERYDFLWVIDNSGSMSNIRAFMAQNLNTFITVLQGRRDLDWQMAVTTTDYFGQGGNLTASSNGVRVVRPTTANAASVWSSIINNIKETPRSGWEQGLESGFGAIDKYRGEFTRTQTPLIVTYISDEEDYSCASGCNISGVPEANTSKWTAHPTSRYVNQFASLKNELGANIVLYPIVHLLPLGGSNPCKDDYGTKGGRYMTVQSAVGTGVSMSICEDKLAQSFDRVARLTANLGACFKLKHTLTTTDAMEVSVDGHLVNPSATDGYTYEASQRAVCFNGNYVPENGSQIEVYYRGY